MQTNRRSVALVTGVRWQRVRPPRLQPAFGIPPADQWNRIAAALEAGSVCVVGWARRSWSCGPGLGGADRPAVDAVSAARLPSRCGCDWSPRRTEGDRRRTHPAPHRLGGGPLLRLPHDLFTSTPPTRGRPPVAWARWTSESQLAWDPTRAVAPAPPLHRDGAKRTRLIRGGHLACGVDAIVWPHRRPPSSAWVSPRGWLDLLDEADRSGLAISPARPPAP